MAARSLKALIRVRHGPGDMLPNLKGYPDRAVAIIISIGVEDKLEDLVLTRMITLSKTDKNLLFVAEGPLSRFSSKIRLAFGLGLIGPETRRDLMRIKDLRNTFAHARINVDFWTPEIAQTCARLELPDNPRFMHISDEAIAKQPAMKQVKEYYDAYRPDTEPRNRFLFATNYIVYRMSQAWHEIMKSTEIPRPSAFVP